MIVYLLPSFFFYLTLNVFFFVYVSSLCALSSWALPFVGFLLLHKDTVFTLSCFFLTASVFHGTMFGSWFGWYTFCCCCFHVDTDKVFVFIIWILCSSFWRVSNLFLIVNLFLLQAFALVNEDQSYLVVLTFSILFLRRLRRNFAVTNLWSEDTP